MKYEFLEKIRGEIGKCTKCASCQAGCPTYEQTSSETLVARGKIRLAGGVLNEEISLSPRVENDFFQCLSCMNCKAACPSGVDTMKIFSAMRAEVYREKGAGPIADFIFRYVLPYPRMVSLLAKLAGIGAFFYKMAPSALAGLLPYANDGIKRVTPDFLKRNLRSRVKEINPPGVAGGGSVKRVVYYSGCMTDLAYPETGLKVIEKLREAGLEVIFPKGQVCCGAPAYYSGDVGTAKKLARRNVEVLGACGADAIVYSCATCGSVVGETYRNLFPDDAVVKSVADKMIDFQKLLINLKVEAAAISKNGSGRKLKVTYHDPCHLRRGMGVWKEPRELIKSLPGVEFVEMEGADRCCGGAGTFAMKYYDMAMDIGRFKADAVRKSGADVLATACPSCQAQLADALNRFGVDVPVVHTAELLDCALRARGESLQESKASSDIRASAASARG